MSWMLGIGSYGEVLEGESEQQAHLVWPQPVVTLAKFSNGEEELLAPAAEGQFPHLCFREDSYDPVSRIRRGRFYKSTGRAGGWTVIESTNMRLVGIRQQDGLINVSARSYESCRVTGESKGHELVILGSQAAFSLWSVIGIETISTREEMVTLKARQSFGALPDVYWGRIPGEHRHKVEEAIRTLADDYRRAAPESVIDRAREAATAILSAYLQNLGVDGAKGKDLGDLVKLLSVQAGPHGQRVVACAAEIPQRLHSRGKHAEKEKRDNLRPIREQDAELAVQCIGVMLCDLRWADWK